MAHNQSIRRYRNWYAKLLRLHSRPYHDRFGEGMEQTFSDVLRESAGEDRGLFGCALWMFAETSAEIIRERIRLMMMQGLARRLSAWAAAVLGILMVPLVAMQLSDDVNWSLGDFIVMGALLFGAGFTYELISRTSGSMAYRAAIGVAVAAGFFLIWVNLAVGLIGSENNDANAMYIGVLAVAIIGATAAGLEPRRMAYAMFAAASVFMLIAVIALIAGMHRLPESSVYEIVAINVFFAIPWVVSALLFRRAGATKSKLISTA